jgi:hypothetical protein
MKRNGVPLYEQGTSWFSSSGYILSTDCVRCQARRERDGGAPAGSRRTIILYFEYNHFEQSQLS